jgi:uncharacterized protein YkwD
VRVAVAGFLAALTLAPASVAGTPISGFDARLAQTPFDATPSFWQRIAGWSASQNAVRPSADGSEATEQRALEGALLRVINDVRRGHGLRPLVSSRRLAVAAAEHTREMGAQGYFEHESFDSTPFWKRIQQSYPSRGWRAWSVGENLLYSSPDVAADSGVDMWMHSPPHRANLLSRTWREIGIAAIHFGSAPGEYDGDPVTIVTADFGYRR